MADDTSKLDAIYSKISFLKEMSSSSHRRAFSDDSFLKCESCLETKPDDMSMEEIRHKDDCFLMKWIKELDAEWDAEYERVYGKIKEA